MVFCVLCLLSIKTNAENLLIDSQSDMSCDIRLNATIDRKIQELNRRIDETASCIKQTRVIGFTVLMLLGCGPVGPAIWLLCKIMIIRSYKKRLLPLRNNYVIDIPRPAHIELNR